MHDDEVDEIMHGKKTGSKMRTPPFLRCMPKSNTLFMLLYPHVELFVSLWLRRARQEVVTVALGPALSKTVGV